MTRDGNSVEAADDKRVLATAVKKALLDVYKVTNGHVRTGFADDRKVTRCVLQGTA